MEENKITPVSDVEAQELPRLCEIRFDCLITMFEAGYKDPKGLSLIPETPQKPQWFKSQNKLSLEAIRYTDEYSLGLRLKQMLRQLDNHIDKYKRD